MSFLKKLSIANIFYCVAALFGLLGMIFTLITNGVQANDLGSQAGLGITISILAFLVGVCGFLSSIKFTKAFWMSVVLLVAIAGFGFMFGFILLNRVELISSLFSWDSTNSLGWTAFGTSVVAIVFYALASILITVGMFLRQDKKDAVEA
jgi:hypothetical protein